MKSTSDYNYIVADFETTVYEGQTETAVWSACWSRLFSDDISLKGNIDDFMKALINYRTNVIVYFHNLKFDGNFIIYYLLTHEYTWKEGKANQMPMRTFNALISDKNRFYDIKVRTPMDKVIEFRDSVKLLPFSLRQVSSAFNTKHKKLDMEYKGYRYPDCPISDAEKAYILNDVLVLKEAMEIMIMNGHTKLTIGSCCVAEYKTFFDKMIWLAYFPNLKEIPCKCHSEWNTDTYIRRTYKGAWCYLKESGTYFNGATYDVNSLYPSVMHSKSGNYYPVGIPTYFYNKIPEKLIEPDSTYVWFIHLKCRFTLKEGYLPTIQIKNNFLYDPTEWLSTSDIKWKGNYYRQLRIRNETYDCHAELYLTFKDYELLTTHYVVEDLEIIDGCYFTGELGVFDEYIDKWMERKETAKTKVERTEAKLFLNNLYGKLAGSDNSSYQIPYLDESGVVQFELVTEFEKPVFSIDKGSMVTSYARYFTITHAQKNYDNFIYADTDSLHMRDGDVYGINIHPTNMLCWKKESRWKRGIFIRQKTYAEFIYEEDGIRQYPSWHITCAGMPERAKRIFLSQHPITDFKYGLTVSGKLVPKRIKGGVILVDTDFTLKNRKQFSVILKENKMNTLIIKMIDINNLDEYKVKIVTKSHILEDIIHEAYSSTPIPEEDLIVSAIEFYE